MPFTRGAWRHAAVLALGAILLSCARGGPAGITTADLARHVSYLASDELAGRLTGSPGIARAEVYIARAFREDGLRPLPGATGYFVDYTAWRIGYDPGRTTLVVRSSAAPIATGELDVDFRPFDFSGLGRVEAELLFAGYGITAPEYGYDDYKGLDAKGRVVLVLRYEPNEGDPNSAFAGPRNTSHAYFATKVRNAREHGAIGMLLFTTPLEHGPVEDLRASSTYRLHRDELASAAPADAGGFIALQVSQGFAGKITAAAGTTIRELERAVNAGTTPAELGLHGLILAASVARDGEPRPVLARDVVGYLPGTRGDSMVLVGAHHDHLGAFAPDSDPRDASVPPPDRVYNGADDDASGVAGVLELAQAFGRRRGRPERGMVFATFSGEEEYLLGSEALLESGLLSPTTIALMINLDMIGRNPARDLDVIGGASDAKLRDVVTRADEPVKLGLSFAPGLPYGLDSDQSVFRNAGVPSLFFHTGLHDDYHGLDDEADRLDYDRLRRVVELAYRVLEERSAAGGAAPVGPAR